MKKLLVLLLIGLLIGGGTFGFAEDDVDDRQTSLCPVTKVDDSCMDCHAIPDWSLIEKLPNANRNFPFGPDMTIKGEVAYLFITSISSTGVDKFF